MVKRLRRSPLKAQSRVRFPAGSPYKYGLRLQTVFNLYIMLRYYYVEQKNRLYVYDCDSGFYKSFNGEKWVTPAISFQQVERDNDVDFVEISESAAKEFSNGIGFEKELMSYLRSIKWNT